MTSQPFSTGVIHKCLALLSVDIRESKLVYCNFFSLYIFLFIDKVVAVGLIVATPKLYDRYIAVTAFFPHNTLFVTLLQR